MQAPTTASGSATREPAERTCSGCGAANGVAAAFCWQCYRPFGAPGPRDAGPAARAVGPMRPGIPAPPATFPSSLPQTRSVPRSGLGTIAGVVLLTAAVIAGVVFFLNRSGVVAMPEAVAGMPIVENPQTQLVVDTFGTQLETVGIEGDIAMYGNGFPTVVLTWMRDASVPTTDAAFDQFAAGFNVGIGSSGSLGGKSTETVAGVTYVCATVLGVSQGTICMWQDEEVFWLVFELMSTTGLSGTDLAVAAHDAVEAA